MPCSRFVPNVGYMSQILDCVAFEEMNIMCSLWDIVGSHGAQAGINGGPFTGCSNCEFGGPKEDQAVGRDAGTCGTL